MPAAAERWRLALFYLAVAALAAAGVVFAGAGTGSTPTPTTASPPAAARAPVVLPSSAAPPPVAALRASLGREAHRFLGVFFRYEVGARGPALRSAVRATATPAFAAELLGSPPPPPSRPLAPARPGRLTITLASVSPPRALVSGSASRGGPAAEQFSFLFEADHGAWLASGAGE